MRLGFSKELIILFLKRVSRDTLKTFSFIFIQFACLLFFTIFSLRVPSRLVPQDVTLYYEYATQIVDGKVPYRDVQLEYPPLALIPMLLPNLVTFGLPISLVTYTVIFAFQNILFSTITMLVLLVITQGWQSMRSASLVLCSYAQSVIVLSPFLLWRYDIFPALLSVFGLYAILKRRPLLAGVLFGAGIAVKLYSVVLFPVFCLYYWVKRDKRALFSLCIGCTMLLGLVLLLSAWISQGDVIIALRYHLERGLQIESFGAGLVSLFYILGWGKVVIENNYNAFHMASPLADIMLAVLPVIFIATLSWVLARCLCRFRKEQAESGEVAFQSLVGYSTSVLLVFLASNKVFSPQFLLWVLPFAALLSIDKARLFLVISLLSVAVYPLLYSSLLAQQPFAVLILNLRNALMVALLVWLLFELRRGRESKLRG